MTQKDLFFAIFDVIIISVIVVMCHKTWKEKVKIAYRKIMIELCDVYLCQYSLYHMIDVSFFHRFGHFNGEGFCYTFSAAIMLGLKNLKHTRLMRGYVKDRKGEGIDSLHSWVEVKLFGHWFVVDPCLYVRGFTLRRYHRKRFHCEVRVIYDYATFWQDPLAEQFYQRMRECKSSMIFVELYWHYTPKGKGNVAIENMIDDQIEWPGDREYFLFPYGYGYKFSQRIVNEFMVRSARRSPRRRTLRRLESYYKSVQRKETETTPA